MKQTAKRQLQITGFALFLLTAVMGLSLTGTAAAATGAMTAIELPQGAPAYKIEVAEDGIYEISGADLATAGMDLSSVDVTTLQMMHRGQAVAFQFINNDGLSDFGTDDRIRFYGWAFDGSRYEDMFVDRNIYWLWADGTQTLLGTVANEAAVGHQTVTSFDESLTDWSHNVYFPGWGVDWQTSPNDATAWHIRLQWVSQTAVTSPVFRIDLPDPVPGSSPGQVTVELTSRQSTTSIAGTHTYGAGLRLNGSATVVGSTSWINQANVNVIGNITGDDLVAPGKPGYPSNRIFVDLTGSINGDLTQEQKLGVYITRFTVDYERQLQALGDELQFGQAGAGAYAFQVGRMSESTASEALVWDISDRLQPVAIQLLDDDISAAGGAYSWEVRRTIADDAQFFATTNANLRAPLAISEYVADPLSPANGAEWVAISHGSLLGATQSLATHRAATSGLSTWVIDVEDIINQVGHGYHLPTVLQEYLKDAYATWNTPPAYIALIGDATVNPRNLGCAQGCEVWDPAAPTLVVTDLLFEDRFMGLIPVDYTFALLAGDDLLPEAAVARIPAETLAEAQQTVDKIITFETNAQTLRPEQHHYLFVADNTDGGGNFCLENTTIAGQLPAGITKTQLCLPDNSEASTDILRNDIFDNVNNIGALILNYRGHGSIDSWADGPIMDISDAGEWDNGAPMVIISADCLDGHFAMPGREGLGETYLGLLQKGTAAHWSSSGLGFSVEHSILHSAFYEALFQERMRRIGDVVSYAKIDYLNAGQDPSEALAFTLLGDPAMDLIAPVADISGTVSLAGRGAPLTAGTIKLIDNDGNFAEQMTTFDAQTGAFELIGVPVDPAGSNYRLEATHDLYLGNALEDVMTGQPIAVPSTVLRGGDANNDGIVNINDLSCIGSAYNVSGPAASDCGGEGSSDINADTHTDIFDLTAAGGSYFLSTFQPWTP